MYGFQDSSAKSDLKKQAMKSHESSFIEFLASSFIYGFIIYQMVLLKLFFIAFQHYLLELLILQVLSYSISGTFNEENMSFAEENET